MKVGDTIWKFDRNHRIYERDNSGSPIYIKHWVPTVIKSETSRSWVTRWAGKAPKKGPHPGWAFTWQEVLDDVWVKEHKFSIENALSLVNDISLLKQVAE